MNPIKMLIGQKNIVILLAGKHQDVSPIDSKVGLDKCIM